MVTIVITVKKGILLLSDAEVCRIFISFPASEGAIKLGVLPVDRKNSFAFKLFTKDGEMARRIDATDAAVIFGAVFVTVTRVATVTTNKIVDGVGGYDGDAGCSRGRWRRRAFTITVGKVRRGRSGGTCNSCSTGGSGRASTMRSSEGVRWFIKVEEPLPATLAVQPSSKET
jgi:hypothetical protein